MNNDAWTTPQRSMRALLADIVGATGGDQAPEAQAGIVAAAADSSSPWDDLADQAHDDGQAVLDALARRARRIGRRMRRTRNAPIRILKLMD